MFCKVASTETDRVVSTFKQLTENKAVACGCNVFSTSRNHANKNNEKSANSLENNEKSNKNLNPTKKI